MKDNKKYEKFGRLIVSKLRDEVYSNYLEESTNTRLTSKVAYYKKDRNPNYDSDFQKTDDERFEFFNSLNENQKEQLDKLILKTID